jgi:hypothetical protein
MADDKKLLRRDRDASAPVSKAEFVGLMTLLGQKDRAKYRELRAIGWDGAIPRESDIPN